MHKGQSHHYNPFPHPPASSASAGTGRGSHLSSPSHCSGWGLLPPRALQGPECHLSQSLLRNQPWEPLPVMRDHQCCQGLSAKAWGWVNRSRESNTVGCADTAEGMGVRGCVAGNAPRGSMVCLESEVPLLRGAWGAEPPLPPHASYCLLAHWEGLHPEQAHHSLLQLPAAPCCCRQLTYIPIVPAVPLLGLSE